MPVLDGVLLVDDDATYIYILIHKALNKILQVTCRPG